MSHQPANTRQTPPGLFVTLDKLQYGLQPSQAPRDKSHLFAYHLTIHNQGSKAVTILARKWILTYEDGEMDVIEGDKVVGQTPEVAPGKSFSYNSFHLVGKNATVTGAFHGVDTDGTLVAVPIPAFELQIPGESAWN